MSQCSPASDCFKASLQFKIDKAEGKTSPETTKSQWQVTSESQGSPTSAAKSPDRGSQFDAEG